MRILYGVQGTGNGHITRARVMAGALRRADLEVDYLFSGRPAERYFNMEPFGNYLVCPGLTLVTDAGRVRLWRTLRGNNLYRLWRDVQALDLSGYDLVITDFEPISAWAARRQRVPSVGIAHQYAFCHPVPGIEQAPWLRPALTMFAPVEQAVGVHWDAFGQPILPPLIEPSPCPPSAASERILVYLPFERLEAVCDSLGALPQQRFIIYAAVDRGYEERNLQIKPFSRTGFQVDLASCDGVIANAGFGLCSEAIQAGKKLLVKPLAGQIEQAANARALELLGHARVISALEVERIRPWLQQRNPAPRPWPDTAQALVDWILDGRREPIDSLARRLWQELPASSPLSAV